MLEILLYSEKEMIDLNSKVKRLVEYMRIVEDFCGANAKINDIHGANEH